jgi:hypothetical protein
MAFEQSYQKFNRLLFIGDGGAIGGTIQGLPVLSEGPVYLTG